MTVKKRLFWSNIFMILVPVLAALLVGSLCVGFIWTSLLHGVGMGMDDPKNFTYASMALTEAVEHRLEAGKDLSSLQRLLDGNGLTLRVLSSGQTVFSYGEEDPKDSLLLDAAAALEGEASITQSGRSLYQKRENIHQTEYLVCVFGENYSKQTYFNLKAALVVSAGVIFLTVILSVLLTNRFLTKFVFRHIAEPLNVLADGVRQIRDGNLDYRMVYEQQDEFAPVCAAFNEMALRLKDSVDRTQRQERSRRELLAGISHDIRSPLTSIQAYVEGLLDGVAKTPEAQRRYLETVRTKAGDLEHMVSQLFLLSKLELGEEPGQPCVLQLDELIRQIAGALENEYSQKVMELELQLEPCTVYADPVQFGRVLNNILENSVKYKEKERGKVRLSLQKEGEDCLISIGDDGPGVPEESLPRLFEVFYRSDPARQNPHQGSGLGLAIAARIVHGMGGEIWAKNIPGGGLLVEMRLPGYRGEDYGQNTAH